MEKIKFKNLGHFCEENSCRYEYKVNDNFSVRVYSNYYFNGFIFEFISSSGVSLNSINGNFLSSWWNKATKKDTIIRVQELLNDKECFDELNKISIQVNNKND